MKVTRQQAIKIIDRATDRGDYDDWWIDLMEQFGLYDEKTDKWPSIDDVLKGLGVKQSEIDASKPQKDIK